MDGRSGNFNLSPDVRTDGLIDKEEEGKSRQRSALLHQFRDAAGGISLTWGKSRGATALKRQTLVVLSVLVLVSAVAIPIIVWSAPGGGILEAQLWSRANTLENRGAVVATLGGHKITRADYEYSLAMNSDLTRPVPEDAPEVLRALDAVHERYTPQERALARCIGTAAQYIEARRLGVAVSLEEARAHVEQMRLEAADAESQEYFKVMEEAFGAETYWEEIAPATYRQLLSIMALRKHLLTEDPGLKGLEGRLTYEYELARRAADRLAIVDNRLGVSAARVKEYLEDTWRVVQGE